MKKTVIFTGAGAGKADGLPLQTELFHEFFSRAGIRPSRSDLVKDLARFLQVMFGVNPSDGVFPTFEEAMGVLDLAISREEVVLALGGTIRGGEAERMRRQLILALGATIARDRTSAATAHSKLIAALRDGAKLNDTTFITTNYDTLLDDAIESQGIGSARGVGSLVDYGFGALVKGDSSHFAEGRTFPCYKIHGSLNWLHCGACDVLDVTYASDGITRLVDEPSAAKCPTCETLRTPVIVPPSYYKNMTNVHLAAVWSQAFQRMRSAEHLIFCGYSFPDADMHIKYLVKRAQLNRDPVMQPLRVTLVNNHDGKSAELIKNEYERFRRFIGNGGVADSGLSFEEFAVNPVSVLGS